jgi:hypothetical protein
MVVDSNVGFNKVNPNVEQTIDYQVVLHDPVEPTATLTLAYEHRIDKPMPACIHESRYGDNYADLLERCYWDYLRVYVPAGSELIAVSGTDGPVSVYEESGRMVIATSFLLETGQARAVEITFRPNLAAVESEYSLLVQKQPGTDALPLRISVTPPSDSRPTTVSPPGLSWVDGSAVWQGSLRSDQEIELHWE